MSDDLLVAPMGEIVQEHTIEEKPKDEFFDEAGAALASFKRNMEAFAKMLDVYSGSKRQIIKSWINSALEPFHDKKPNFSYPGEEELFKTFVELESAKFILMVHGLKDVGVLSLHKPLMSSTPQTQSERDLREEMTNLTSGPEIDLGKRDLPTLTPEDATSV